MTGLSVVGDVVLLAGGAALFAVVCAGIGHAVRRRPVASHFTEFWRGWIVVSALLLGLHLFWPVASWMWGVVVALSCVGWWRVLRKRGRLRVPAPTTLTAALVLIIGAMAAAQAPLHYDFGLYYAQTIAWFTEGPAVPGLANLHARLGYNNSSLAPAALLSTVTPFDVRHIAVLAPLAVAFSEVVTRAVGASGGRYTSASRWVARVLIPGCLVWLIGWSGSASPDAVVFALQIAIGVRLFDLALVSLRDRSFDASFHDIVFMSCGLVTVKLAAAGFGLLVVVVAVLLRGGVRHVGVGAFVAPALVLAVWGTHGVALSGYPAFPIAALGVPVDWRVPVAIVKEHVEIISGWARSHLAENAYAWFWLVIPVLGAAIGIVPEARRQGWRKYYMVLAPPLGGVVLVAVTAPNPRFAGACLHLAAALSVGGIVLLEGRPTKRAHALAVLMAAAMVVPMYSAVMARVSTPAFSPAPVVAVVGIELVGGGRVDVPLEGDQAYWARVPTRPQAPDPSLRMREDGVPQRGYRRETYVP